MMKTRYFFLLLALCFSWQLMAQTNKGTNFYGNDKNIDGWQQEASYMQDADVERLVTTMLAKNGIKNRFIIKSTDKVENCQATLQDGKPYILYNPVFLNRVKSLNFTVSELPATTGQDWFALTILAHELGHHVNNHLTNPPPDLTQRDLELEADEFAGYLMYLMGATLEQAQLCYQVSPEAGSYTHPPRVQRLQALKKGYDAAATKNNTNNPQMQDTDGDGVADNTDRCPDEKGSIENAGCPVLQLHTGAKSGSSTTKAKDAFRNLMKSDKIEVSAPPPNTDEVSLTASEEMKYKAELSAVTNTEGAEIVFRKIYKQSGKCPTASAPCITFEVIYPYITNIPNANQDTINRLNTVITQMISEITTSSKTTLLSKIADKYIANYYENEDRGEMGWSFYMFPEFFFNTQNILSFGFAVSEFSGGAHPANFTKTCNMSLKSGKAIQLSEKLNPDYIPTLTQWVKQQIFQDDSSDADFHLSNNIAVYKEGLIFIYNPCEITACSAGEIRVEVPLAKHPNMLKKTK